MTPPIVVLDEAAMQAAEARIPELAEQAVRQARQQALQISGRVIEAVDGQLVETRASGERHVLRSLPARIPVRRGMTLTRRAPR